MLWFDIDTFELVYTRLRPRPRWGAYSAPPDPLVRIKGHGPTSHRREGRELEREEGEGGKGEREEGEGEGRKRMEREGRKGRGKKFGLHNF